MIRLPPALVATLTVLATAASAQHSARREAPGPVLLRWERTLQDAAALSRETGKPLLICVNADGESASEIFVAYFYNAEDFASLTRGFVPIILSPDRHNPRDHDRLGRRIPCPRFGRVTCGEHRDAEPQAYERYFDGQRVAPRHLGVSPAGEVLFDLFLLEAYELERVDEALAEHTGNPLAAPGGTGVHARTADARAELEQRWLDAEDGARARLLAAAAESDVPQPGLVRMALASGRPDLARAAARALAQVADQACADLLVETLRRDESEELQAELLAALERVATTDEQRRAVRDRWAVQARSERIVVEVWESGLEEAAVASAAETISDEELYRRVDELDEASRQRPADGALQLEIASAWYELGLRAAQRPTDPAFYFMDARSAAREALAKGADDLDVESLLARVQWRLGKRDEAAEHARAAIERSSESAASAPSAEVLGIFAMARASEIWSARSRGEDFPPEWLTDAHAAFGILARHPLGEVDHARAHADLLLSCGLAREARGALRRSLERFPESAELHELFRRAVTLGAGAAELGEAYRALAPALPRGAVFDWFAGYAELGAAEELQRGGEPAAADAAYGRAVARFDACREARPEYADSADHYAALALAGRARSALEAGDPESAARHMAVSIPRRVETAELADGLQRTPLDTLRRIRRAIDAAGREDLLALLAGAIEPLAPEVWKKSEP